MKGGETPGDRMTKNQVTGKLAMKKALKLAPRNGKEEGRWPPHGNFW